jgi:dermatan/chondrotin sulfate uronyl 2-O-sulfotransferase UST
MTTKPLLKEELFVKDFETCVLDGDRECLFLPGEVHDGVGDHRRQAMFFCGHHEKCVYVDIAMGFKNIF